MVLRRYIAMTASEFSASQALPSSIAWMACHFSCYGTGLSNLPQTLPENAMIIVNDRTPPHGHDKHRIAMQLQQLADRTKAACFLLDFQREAEPETQQLAEYLVGNLSRPVGVAQGYAAALDCPIFLTAPKPHQTLTDVLKPWKGKKIWLEIATEAETATVTEKGCTFTPAALETLTEPVFEDDACHCRYHTQLLDDRVIITIQRTQECIAPLLEEADSLGIELAVGLYQQFKQKL